MSEARSTTGSLSRQASIMVVSKGVAVASQLASIVVLTRVLSKETFGLLSFLLLAYATVTTLGQVGLPESVFYFFERVSVGARKTLAVLVSKLLFVIGLGASLLLVALTFLAPGWGFEVGGLFLPLVALVLLELPVTPLPNVLIALDNAVAAAWLNIVTGVGQFLALVIPALLGLPLSAIVTALVIYGTLRFAFALYLFVRNLPGEGEPVPEGTVKELFAYSIPLGLSQILWGVNRQIDKYIVAAFLPVAVYAEYTVGAWEIPFLPAIAYSVAAVMMPRMVSFHMSGKTEELLSLWNRSIRRVTIVLVPVVVLFLVVAEEFIVLMFSEDYLPAVVPFRIYTLIILHRVASYSSMLKALGDTKVITMSAIYLLLTNVAFSIPLVMWLGVAGPPLATLIASMVTWAYVLVKIGGQLNVPVGRLFPTAFYLRALGVAAVVGVAVWYLKERVDLPMAIELPAVVVGYLGIYVAVASLTRVASVDDWKYMGRALGLGRG